MPIFFIKSLLSILLFILTIFAIFTMFEVFGRLENRFNIERLKKLHRLNGKVYILLYILIAYFCLDFVVKTKAEPSPRATFHAIFAISVITLLFLKLSFIHIYKKFYNQVKIIGILIALLTIGMIGTSAGYYLLITKFGIDIPVKRVEKIRFEEKRFYVKNDTESIVKGKELYESKCSFCHETSSTKWGVGPGHKGILKNPLLPVSKKPATPENVANQIRNPYKDMPSFSYLSDEDILNLIAYLNTL
ncbi:MAG: cytochrome c [Nitrospirae bacterium]|nr:cytochrome c [Nitrospirota bacterium]